MASSSSTHQQPHHHLLSPYTTTSAAAPPPTPSSKPATSTAASADTLTRLLHRLPPDLSLPTCFSRRATCPPSQPSTTALPKLSFSNIQPKHDNLTSCFELGYFQLSHHDHSISTQLAESAELEALSLFDLPNEVKHACFPRDWPLGFDDDEDDNHTASFCLDGRVCDSKTSESQLSLTSLRELTRVLKELGLHVVEKMAGMVGFENPFKENGPMGPISLMWVSTLEEGGNTVGRLYPYVVQLQYQIRACKWSFDLGSGSVCVEPEVGSVLVTVGDIAQVWSNGKLKKVRGRPAAVTEEGGKTTSRSISMTMLLTLPIESSVSPLLSTLNNNYGIEGSKSEKDQEDASEHQRNEASTSDIGNGDDYEGQRPVFSSFSFEDYAWRVYYERFLFKDPLDRYRVTS